jgi:hypothetical protein
MVVSARNVVFLLVCWIVLSLPVRFAPMVSAQESEMTCPVLVSQALEATGTACAQVGRNEACYGHTLVTATFQDGTATTQFETSGDLVPLTDLQTLVTQPADPAAGTWGIALLKVAADLPEADDMAMTFVLFGDTEIATPARSTADLPTCDGANQSGSNVNVRVGPGQGYAAVDVLPSGTAITANGRNTAGDWIRLEQAGAMGWVYAPLMTLDCPVETLQVIPDAEAVVDAQTTQSFILRTNTASACDEAPDGLRIDSPDGQRAHIMVNGVQLEFSSSAFLTAQPDNTLNIRGLTGEIVVTAQEKTVTVTPGTQTQVPLTGSEASGPPAPPAPVPSAASPVPFVPRHPPASYDPGDFSNIRVFSMARVWRGGQIEPVTCPTGITYYQPGDVWAVQPVQRHAIDATQPDDSATVFNDSIYSVTINNIPLFPSMTKYVGSKTDSDLGAMYYVGQQFYVGTLPPGTYTVTVHLTIPSIGVDLTDSCTYTLAYQE